MSESQMTAISFVTVTGISVNKRKTQNANNYSYPRNKLNFRVHTELPTAVLHYVHIFVSKLSV
jgi:hypothetical protein